MSGRQWVLVGLKSVPCSVSQKRARNGKRPRKCHPARTIPRTGTRSPPRQRSTSANISTVDPLALLASGERRGANPVSSWEDTWSSVPFGVVRLARVAGPYVPACAKQIRNLGHVLLCQRSSKPRTGPGSSLLATPATGEEGRSLTWTGTRYRSGPRKEREFHVLPCRRCTGQWVVDLTS